MKVKQRKWFIPSLVFCICFIWSGLSQAQIKVGATAGVNLNSFGQPGITIGGNVGAFGRYQILDFLEAQAEIKYSLVGGGRHDRVRSFDRAEDSFDAITGVSTVEYINRSAQFNTIEVPLSARFTLPELNESTITPKFIVGFSYAFIFRADEQRDAIFNFNNGNQILLSDTRENIGADIASSNLSYIGGFALDFALDNGNVFTTEFRYQRGINNLNTVQIADPIVTERLSTQTFSINFAYQIFSF